MNISGLSSQIITQDVTGNQRLQIKSADTMGWSDFQDRVKEQAKAQQNENSVSLVKNSEKSTGVTVKIGQDEKTDQVQVEAQSGQETEGGSGDNEQNNERGRTIDKIV